MSLGAASAAGVVGLPGVGSPGGIGGDDVQTCDVDAEIVVDSNIRSGLLPGDWGGDALELKEESFYYETSESGFFSMTFLGPDRELSFATSENARVTWTLTGENIDGAYQEIDEMDEIGTVLDSKTSEFSARDIPEGNYRLDMDLTHEGGADGISEEIGVNCS